MTRRGQGHPDSLLILLTLVLVGVGLLMIFSASAILAERRYADPAYFVKRQAAWVAIGLLVGAVMMRSDYRIWKAAAFPLTIGVLTLLALVLVPSFGTEVNGSRRWFRVLGVSFQPSELAKWGIVVYLANYLHRHAERMERFVAGLLPPLLIVGATVLLVAAEPDLGTAITLTGLAGLMLFAGGARIRHLIVLGLALLPWVLHQALQMAYRRDRLLAYLDPWRDPDRAGFQVIQSFLSFGAGGLFGAGVGEGRQKLLFLPEPHTDFVYAVIAEELGLMGTAALVLLFVLFFWRGLSIALACPDSFGRHLALGASLLIGLQAVMNMAVVTALVPTKGLPLPLLSYGGSSIVVTLAATGVLLSVSQRTPPCVS